MNAPTDYLVRMNQEPYGLAEDGNTLYGYLAVFGQDTEINSWEGNFIERIAPGAFDRTLERRGHRVKILYDHGLDPSIGNKPLGKPEVLEPRQRGLYVEVPLDDTSYNQDLKASLGSGAIDGMSFRFSVPAGGDEWVENDGELPVRTINEAVLLEGGPVTFPAYEGATAGIRTAEDLQQWRAGCQHTDHRNTGTDLAPEEPAAGTSPGVDGPPAEAPVNPAKQLHRQLQHQLMEVP